MVKEMVLKASLYNKMIYLFRQICSVILDYEYATKYKKLIPTQYEEKLALLLENHMPNIKYKRNPEIGYHLVFGIHLILL